MKSVFLHSCGFLIFIGYFDVVLPKKSDFSGSKWWAGVIALFVGLILNIAYSKVTLAQTAVYSPRVLFIGFDPTDSTGASLANTYYRSEMGGVTADVYEQNLANQMVQDFQDLSAGRINYQVVGSMRVTDFPTYPNGYQYTVESYSQCVWGRPEFNPQFCDGLKWTFPYVSWLTEHQVCEQAKSVNADEIWIVSPAYIMAYESLMIGPTFGFWVNGPSLVVPACDKHLIIVDAVYNRPDTVLESYAHRLESTMGYVMSIWDPTERYRHWERFAAQSPLTRSSGQPFCGNAHFPFNFRYEYDTSNTAAAVSSCADWQNFPDYTGTTGSYGCTTWGCSNRGWQKHWFGSLPNRAGTTTIPDALGTPLTVRTDWWYYLLYPENAISFVTGRLNPSPTPFGLADINFDGAVDGRDGRKSLELWGIRSGSPPDQNLDTYMNLVDFAAIVSQIY